MLLLSLMGKDLGFKSHFNPTLCPENTALEVVLHKTDGLAFHMEKQAQATSTEASPQESLLTSWHLWVAAQ